MGNGKDKVVMVGCRRGAWCPGPAGDGQRPAGRQYMKKTNLLAATCASVLMLSALCSGAAPSINEFDIVMVAISPTTWASIKYNTGTGESWIAQSGKWMPIEETTKILKGKYCIKMTALSNDWAAIRFEVNSGQSWQCRAGAWAEITHATASPLEQPVRAKSSDNTGKLP